MLVSIRHPMNPGRMFVEEVHDMTEAVLRFGTDSKIEVVADDPDPPYPVCKTYPGQEPWELRSNED